MHISGLQKVRNMPSKGVHHRLLVSQHCVLLKGLLMSSSKAKHDSKEDAGIDANPSSCTRWSGVLWSGRNSSSQALLHSSWPPNPQATGCSEHTCVKLLCNGICCCCLLCLPGELLALREGPSLKILKNFLLR